MVLTPRIVLFHDSPPQGAGYAEVFEPGLGLCHGIVPLPHARQRLRLGDPLRVRLLARRFAPDACVPLDGEAGLDWNGVRWQAHEGTSKLSPSGELVGARE